ncbi:MAG: HAD family phosphatase [Anaerolineae bacterium]|jgi:epoxide hydrolase-like predicted phosphatase
MTNDIIQALVFDYGGVLMRTVDPTARRELERQFNLDRGQAEELVFGSPLWDDLQHGRLDSEAFWADLGERLELDAEELQAFRRGFWSGDRLDQELMDNIRHLRCKGYRTALLSNAPVGLRQYVEDLGIADAFDVIVISGAEGVVKPDPEIYRRALDRLGVAPWEAVFIDDVRGNVEAARRVGLDAWRFRGLAPLRAQLRGLGLPVPDLNLAPLADARAVIFDWGGVMEALPTKADVASWEQRLALEPGVLPQVLWGDVWHKLEVGAITDAAYVEHVADRLDLPDDEAALRFLQAFYTGDRFNQPVIDAVRALRGRYKVAVLSNAFPTQSETIREQHGIDVHAEFDVYVNSADVGLSKPDPGIYRLTLERLRVAPEQAIFLDDSLRNVDSARQLGIHTVQFIDPETSLAELEVLLGHSIAGDRQD